MAGLGLALLTGGAAAADEIESGQAEAAPPEVVQEIAAGRLVTATPAPEAAVNPARVVAHTAQLPRPTGKPTVSVALTKPAPPPPPPPSPSAGPASSIAQPSAGAGKSPPAARTTAPAIKAAAGPARRVRLPLAPSAAEIRREIAARNGGPLSGAGSSAAGPAEAAAKDKPSAGARLQERATTTPTQNPRWPTHVDYSAGPTGPAGGNTAADRKGSLIEATGPQQGVIRNRW